MKGHVDGIYVVKTCGSARKGNFKIHVIVDPNYVASHFDDLCTWAESVNGVYKESNDEGVVFEFSKSDASLYFTTKIDLDTCAEDDNDILLEDDEDDYMDEDDDDDESAMSDGYDEEYSDEWDDEPRKQKVDSDYCDLIAEFSDNGRLPALKDALSLIVKVNGPEILCSPDILNMFDGGYFKGSNQAVKYVLTAMIEKGVPQQLLLPENNSDEARHKIGLQFRRETGFDGSVIDFMLQSMAYSVGLIADVYSRSVYNRYRPYLSLGEPSALPHQAWNPTFSAEQTGQYFRSITEYDDSDEERYGVELLNCGYHYNKDYSCMDITCEVNRVGNFDSYLKLVACLYNPDNTCLCSNDVIFLMRDIDRGLKITTRSLFNIQPWAIGHIKLLWQSNY